MLVLPAGGTRERYVRAHPEFRAVFTSNPEDYAGVNTPQDALVDRMITFDLANHDRDTEVGIVAIRSGLAGEKAGAIVDIVRTVRGSGLVAQSPSLRSAIMIAKVAAAQGLDPASGAAAFTQLCFDVLESKVPTGAADKRAKFVSVLAAAIASSSKGAAA
jgi:nitric oxide reductase NorQ protein